MSLRVRNLPGGCVRSDSSSSSDNSGPDLPERPPTPWPGVVEIPQTRRPQPLRLPFDDRQRESRLVSDEAFDQIMSQAAAVTPTTIHSEPAKPKRSLSVATIAAVKEAKRHKRWSLLGPPIKHEPSGLPTHLSSPTLKREPESFTALPRAPTKNEMAIYADDPPANYGAARKADAILGRNHSISTALTPAPSPTVETSSGARHKRAFSFSASSLVGSVKKRFQSPKEPDFEEIFPSSRRPAAAIADSSSSPTLGGQHSRNNTATTSATVRGDSTVHQTPTHPVIPEEQQDAEQEVVDDYYQPDGRMRAWDDFMLHHQPLYRRLKYRIEKQTPSKTYLNQVIIAERAQNADLRVQHSLMLESTRELRKEWIESEQKLEEERHKSFELECEVFKLKLVIEKLGTEKKRLARGSKTIE